MVDVTVVLTERQGGVLEGGFEYYEPVAITAVSHTGTSEMSVTWL